MRQSKLFGNTVKDSKEYSSKNATLLIKGGFINQTMAGVYSFLPLGQRVLSKIENIIRQEMNEIGQEILMPALAPIELWEKTDRYNNVDILFKAIPANDKSKKMNDSQYVLGSTHEEVVTPIAGQFNHSYKDFPFALYQIQTKFRNEARPKSGLLRGREFRMKDLYSFHTSEEDLLDYYELAKKSYTKIFDRLGLGDDTYIVAASGGDFTKDFSHEFQTKVETGEDEIFYLKKTQVAYNKEIAPAKAPQLEQDKNHEVKKDVEGKGMIGVEELSKFLKIKPEQTTKTLIYKSDKGKIVVACVRGVYDINEKKLIKVAKVDHLELADEATVEKVTGAKVGYAGLLNLPDNNVDLFIDESVENMVNFETGANKTNFHTINVNWGRDIKKPDKFYDIKIARLGDLDPESNEVYEVFNASEVGNIFPLNTKFSKAFDYKYTDQNGKQQDVYMGSYGIGPSRIMGVIAEKFNDDKGLIWPEQVAPFKVHLISLQENQKADKVYQDLIAKGVEVLYDDRNISPGAKLADSDLIGIPYRLLISKKTGKKIEFKKRNSKDTELLNFKNILRKINVK